MRIKVAAGHGGKKRSPNLLVRTVLSVEVNPIVGMREAAPEEEEEEAIGRQAQERSVSAADEQEGRLKEDRRNVAREVSMRRCASSAYCALRHAAPSRHFLSPNLPHGTHSTAGACCTARCGQSAGCAKPHFLFAQRLASRHFFSPKAPHGTQAIGALVTCCSSGGQLLGCAKPHFAFAHDKPSRHLLLPNLPHSTQGG